MLFDICSLSNFPNLLSSALVENEAEQKKENLVKDTNKTNKFNLGCS